MDREGSKSTILSKIDQGLNSPGVDHCSCFRLHYAHMIRLVRCLLFAVRSGGGRACEEVDRGACGVPFSSYESGGQRQQCSPRSASAQVNKEEGSPRIYLRWAFVVWLARP